MRLRGMGFSLSLALCLLLPGAVNAKVSIIGGLTYEKVAKAGEIYRGIILIRNMGDRSEEVKIYQTDYLFSCDGTSVYGTPGQTPRSNANWIRFSPRRMVIPPQEEAAVNYTVEVPNNETLLGTYWSMLMVEESSQSSTEASEIEESALGIRQVMRYGIQMVTHIGNAGARKLAFLDIKLLRGEEGWLLQVDIENTGERWLKPFLWAEFYNDDGSFIDRFDGETFRVYPETSVRYRIGLSEFPTGDYKTLIVADCGNDDLFGATCTLTLER